MHRVRTSVRVFRFSTRGVGQRFGPSCQASGPPTSIGRTLCRPLPRFACVATRAIFRHSRQFALRSTPALYVWHLLLRFEGVAHSKSSRCVILAGALPAASSGESQLPPEVAATTAPCRARHWRRPGWLQTFHLTPSVTEVQLEAALPERLCWGTTLEAALPERCHSAVVASCFHFIRCVWPPSAGMKNTC